MPTLSGNGRNLIVDNPIVMGIINVTSDSFYEKSRAENISDALKMAEKHLQEGATILDIGGQSTRPDSTFLPAEIELARVIPVIEGISKYYPTAYISVDSFYASVIKASVEAGAFMANDISAGSLDPLMLETVASLQVPYVLMHMRGTPQTMQEKTNYEDVINEVIQFLTEKKESCLQKGIKQIIIDPGFGFAKNIEQNFTMIKEFDQFKKLNSPILMGISRKSFIYKTLQTTPENSLEATSYLHQIGLQKGANILRVHDVKEAVETINTFLRGQQNKKPLFQEGPFSNFLN